MLSAFTTDQSRRWSVDPQLASTRASDASRGSASSSLPLVSLCISFSSQWHPLRQSKAAPFIVEGAAVTSIHVSLLFILDSLPVTLLETLSIYAMSTSSFNTLTTWYSSYLIFSRRALTYTGVPARFALFPLMTRNPHDIHLH